MMEQRSQCGHFGLTIFGFGPNKKRVKRTSL